MISKLKSVLAKQAGIGLIQVSLAILVMGIVSVLAFQRFGEIANDARNNSAYEEVSRWLGEMFAIGSLNAHIYTGLNQTDVIEQSAIEDATNVYGLAVVVAVAGGNWQLTYPFPQADSCEYVEARIQGHPGLAGVAPTCNAANALVATIE